MLRRRVLASDDDGRGLFLLVSELFCDLLELVFFFVEGNVERKIGSRRGKDLCHGASIWGANDFLKSQLRFAPVETQARTSIWSKVQEEMMRLVCVGIYVLAR